MLTGDRTVVIHEQFHGLRQRDYLSCSLGLDPFAEELVGERAQRREWVPSQVAGLDRRLAGADQDAAVRVHAAGHRRHLRTAVSAESGQDGPVTGAEELLGALYAHEARAGSDAVEPEPPTHLVLVHDGVGVAVGDTVLVGEPLRALFAA